MKTLALAALLLIAPADEITYTAQSVNVAGPGRPVEITIRRWSSEDERRPVFEALNAPPALLPEASRGTTAGAARGATAGRGRGRGRAGPPPTPTTPIAAFTAALGRAPTVGYLWTDGITGYSIKYAWHMPVGDGTERVILVSNRRLGADTGAWKSTAAATETDYAFTLIELRAGPKGLIEGKTSLANAIAVDNEAKTVALENYSTAAVVLQSAKR